MAAGTDRKSFRLTPEDLEVIAELATRWSRAGVRLTDTDVVRVALRVALEREKKLKKSPRPS